jgi:hypothetical protein
MNRLLAPLLSAQFKTAPTGKPRVILNLFPEAPPPIVHTIYELAECTECIERTALLRHFVDDICLKVWRRDYRDKTVQYLGNSRLSHVTCPRGFAERLECSQPISHSVLDHMIQLEPHMELECCGYINLALTLPFAQTITPYAFQASFRLKGFCRLYHLERCTCLGALCCSEGRHPGWPVAPG